MEWKAIPGLPGYEVSKCGIARCVVPYIGGRGSVDGTRPTRIGHNGYLKFNARKNGKPTTFDLHRALALCFVEGRTEEKNIVDHIDRNRLNNSIDNLRWVSNKENKNNSAERRRVGPTEKAEIIRMRTVDGASYGQIALTLGRDLRTVRNWAP